MIEQLLNSVPAPKADPRAALKAGERWGSDDRGGPEASEQANGFGVALAEERAAYRQAEKAAAPRPTRDRETPPRAKDRADHAESDAKEAKSDGRPCDDAKAGDASKCAAETKSESDEVGVGKQASTAAEAMNGDPTVQPQKTEKLCVGMDDPTVAEISTKPDLVTEDICVMPELDPALADIASAAPADVLSQQIPATAAAEAPVVSPPGETSAAPAGETAQNAAQQVATAPASALAAAVLVAPLAANTAADPAVSAPVTAAEDLAIASDSKRQTPQAAMVQAMLDGAGSLPVAATKTSVPQVPLASAEGLATAIKAVESKAPGLSALNEALSGTVTNFADLVRDFAPHQGMAPRGLDPLTGLEAKPGVASAFAGQDMSRPTPLQMLPIEMGMQAMRGNTRFLIRLDPPELGRVDVKLEISSSGEVKANMVVDRVETLAILRRDQHSLQQAFEQAGLKQSPDSLNFSLRGDGQNGQHAQERREREGRGGDTGPDANALEPQIAEQAMRRVSIPLSRIDLVI